MAQAEDKLSRRDQILQALVHMLETQPGARITTANLAKEVGVSEAALYRHFPSKAKMFEGLISFIEETIFSRINLILQDIDSAEARCQHTLMLVLTFAERNPGMCRLLSGDALSGETERLRQRIQQFFERLETQFRQIIREAELREDKLPQHTASALANLLTAVVEGKIRQFVRTEFALKPTAYWDEQWLVLQSQLLRTKQIPTN
ncbi:MULTISPECIES: nucleoid occlusion factor SlmA [Oceanospirillaceae]|jgi:TetR/AcrR family transcriptional regulator|uniref:Nucleoid occlusion factor SlmA n=1 Tax=Oceanobacter antarcticus TaxID=3133425 RepID=A0ABW8NIH3_9GAMM|tara:strand:- start:1545 stop:2159 length:615 start_codon:yes stop_codon:yes gene_type:complete